MKMNHPGIEDFLVLQGGLDASMLSLRQNGGNRLRGEYKGCKFYFDYLSDGSSYSLHIDQISQPDPEKLVTSPDLICAFSNFLKRNPNFRYVDVKEREFVLEWVNQGVPRFEGLLNRRKSRGEIFYVGRN